MLLVIGEASVRACRQSFLVLAQQSQRYAAVGKSSDTQIGITSEKELIGWHFCFLLPWAHKNTRRRILR